MGDVLPPRRQTVVDRLRRRIELYRRHHNVCLPIHENTTNGLNDQHRRDTLLLRQKYLESKAKKAKKNEHRSIKESAPDASKIISHPKPLKAAAAESSPAITTPEVIADESANSVPVAESAASDQQVHEQPVLPSFSVQIVQQFTNTNSSQAQNPQTIQTNVTVKALPGAVTKCNSPVSVTAAPHQNDSQQQKSQPAPQLPQQLQPQTQPKVQSQQQPQQQPQEQTSITGNANTECKHEKEGSISDLCQRKKTSSNSSGSGGRLSDTFPSLGFAEDSSDDVIHPDILKDLIDDVFTNSADLMKDFNFEDSVGSVKDQDEVDKDADASIIDLVKGSSSPQLPSFSNGKGVFDSQSNTSQQTMELFSRESVSNANNLAVLTATTTATTSTTTGLYPPPVRLPTYNNHNGNSLNISTGLGLDFKLTEPSPAALTLKQMAEQHQNMQQKHQHMNMRIGSPSNATSRTQCNQEGFGDHLTSMRSGFINGTVNNLNSFPKGPSHNGIFNPVAFDPPYPGVEPLRSVFKQEVCLPGMGNHLSETGIPSQQGLHISQMPGRPSAITALKSPAYGATRPLTHYPDPLEQNNINRPISGQYTASVPIDSRMQMPQNQSMHIGHSNQQLAQQVHSVSPDVKQQQSPSIQNNSNMYSNFAGQLTNSPLFHPSMPQPLSYTSQFGVTSGLSRPPPEYKATQPDIVSSNMPMVDHQNGGDPSSRVMYSSAKNNGFPQLQRAPNVTIRSDRFGLPHRPNEWSHGSIHPHHNAIKMDGYSHQDGYLMPDNPHLSVMPRPPLHPQYRLIGPQVDNGRIPRQQVVPSSPNQTVLHQRQQQQIALHAQPVNQSLPSSGMELQAVSSLPVGNGGVPVQTSVQNQIYGHPDITRQEGHHINLDFLDNFESIASDFLNFDQGNGANFPLLDDVEMLSK